MTNPPPRAAADTPASKARETRMLPSLKYKLLFDDQSTRR
jgi:hypothetical protein